MCIFYYFSLEITLLLEIQLISINKKVTVYIR